MSLYWADQIADRLIEKVGKDIVISVASGISPSGSIHIGNTREEMTVDIVFKSLVSKGAKARYVHSWDDYDRLRKVPGNVPEDKKREFENYVGMPLSKIPDIWGCHSSWAEHFEKEFEEAAENLGINPEYISQSEMYQSCKYAEHIKTALNKKDEINEVLNKYRKEKRDGYWPAEIYCEKCWKDSTEITEYDGEYNVSYKCECGNESSFDFRKIGNIKLKWKADWPMRWAYEKIYFEPGGKDHASPGSSYTVGQEIVEIFGWEAPDFIMYDFIGIKGAGGKMSSSTGNTILPSNLLEVYLPEIARFFYTGTKPGKEFDIPLDDEMFKVYEDFYKTERIYFGKEEMENKKKLEHLRRIYEISMIDIPDEMPEQLLPHSIIFLAQIYGKEDLMDMKGLKSKRSMEIIEKTLNWIEKYSPQSKITLNEKPPETELSDEQIKALKILSEELSNNWDEESLQKRIYSLKDEVDVEAKEIFRALYQVLINKPAGPRAGEFILMIGKDRVKRVLDQL